DDAQLSIAASGPAVAAGAHSADSSVWDVAPAFRSPAATGRAFLGHSERDLIVFTRTSDNGYRILGTTTSLVVAKFSNGVAQYHITELFAPVAELIASARLVHAGRNQMAQSAIPNFLIRKPWRDAVGVRLDDLVRQPAGNERFGVIILVLLGI